MGKEGGGGPAQEQKKGKRVCRSSGCITSEEFASSAGPDFQSSLCKQELFRHFPSRVSLAAPPNSGVRDTVIFTSKHAKYVL